jgi:hypothetical protein
LIKGLFRYKKGRARYFLRKSSLALTLAGIGLLLVGLMFTHALFQRQADLSAIDAVTGVVGKLELTDLALFTEARYTRHPSQADLHSAFQDHPVALEHFPAGSVVGPPAGLRSHPHPDPPPEGEGKREFLPPEVEGRPPLGEGKSEFLPLQGGG